MKLGRLANDCIYSNSAECMSAASAFDESAPHPQLSVVVPFLNEQETLPLLKERLQALADLLETYEFVFVSDGSTDRSIAFIEQWAAEDPQVKLVVFTRNFGHQPAVCAGLEFAQGDYIAIIDADLQDPPELMLEMYRTARAEDLDVVYSVREHRDTSPVKRLAYRSFYRLYSYLSESPVNMDSGDFSVLSRRAVNELLVLPERVRFIRGLRSWLGLRSKAVPTTRPERAAGQPQYSWSKLISLAIRGLISFSTKPLRLATISGLLLCMVALLLSLVYVGYWAFGGLHEKLPGFTTLVVLMLFLNGAQFLLVGILGEYVGQIFIEVKQRPVFVVDRTINLPPRSYKTYSENKSYGTAPDSRVM
jgi:glycosyltransferase involved in cell wall biosynthesis